VVLILILAVLRLYHLDADPPTDLSKSTDVYTDPGQYTLWARMYVQSGQFNPFNDYRFVFFLRSSVTALAVIVFKLVGTGVWQSNLVGFLYAFGALLLFAAFIRKISGNLAAAIFLLFAGLDYNLLFYGRLPFLENAMAFYGFLALVLAIYGNKWWWFLLSGMSLAAAIFFGKVLGMVFLFPFACLMVYRFFHDSPNLPKISFRFLAMFAGGFVLVTLIWYFVSYRPMQAQVAGYLQEQTVSLYGSPEGLKSIDDFFYKMVTFGIFTSLFPRMPIPALLSALFLGMILFHVARWRSWRSGFGTWNGGHVFIAAMIIAFYGALMIWNYRPLRYELILIYPICGAAAVILDRMLKPWAPTDITRTPILFYLFCFLTAMTPVYQLYGRVIEGSGGEFYYTDFKYLLWVICVVVTAAVVGIMVLYRKGKLPYQTWPVRALVALLVFVVVATAVSRYYFWLQRPTYINRDMSRDLAMVVSPEAIISGPYGPNMTEETNLKSIIHMFGVSKADPDLFRRYPITHLLVDEPNETRARQDYPDLMKNAVHVMSYVIGASKVKLIRVAGNTGNRQADSYPKSLLELAQDNFSSGLIETATAYSRKFMAAHPNCASACMFLGNLADKMKAYDEAESMMKKAVEISPTTYVLRKRLAEFYRDRFAATSLDDFRQKGLEQYEKAIFFAPDITQLQEDCKKLRTHEAWQLKPDSTL